MLINYPNTATDLVTIGSNASTTAEFWFDPNTRFASLVHASTTNQTVGNGSATVPSLNFGGSDSGFYYDAAGDDVVFAEGGTNFWRFTEDGQLQSQIVGTITNPSFSFSADTDTGIFKSWSGDANSLSITTNGNEVARFSQSSTTITQGNFGVGSTSPNVPLSIIGAGVFTGEVRAPIFYATSTTGVSTFPNASTTALSIGGINVTPYQYHSFTYATTTWTGTTTIPLEVGFEERFVSASCYTDVGTVNVDLYHGSSHLKLLNASTTVGVFTFVTNNDIAPLSKVQVDLGTPGSSPTKLTCTIKKQIN